MGNVEHQANLFRCILCEIGFKTQHALNAHYKSVHKNNFICEHCKKEFKPKAAFTRHNNSIHGAHPIVKEETINNLSHEAQPSNTGDVSCLTASNSKDLLRCQPCDKEFKTKVGLTRHNNSIHFGQPINVSIKTTSWKESSKAVKMSVIEKMDEVLSPMF